MLSAIDRSVPIWEREELEAQERRRYSMSFRSIENSATEESVHTSTSFSCTKGRRFKVEMSAWIPLPNAKDKDSVHYFVQESRSRLSDSQKTAMRGLNLLWTSFLRNFFTFKLS